ncbi:hypothetical protein ACP70R_025548 [Stipagrostis hirtigluma subsp. patula]
MAARVACTHSNGPAAPSTKRLHRGVDGEPAPGQALPVDILLEIAARVDVATLVRCAAASKPLRRDILDPAFRRRRRHASVAAGGLDFDPALLLGISFWQRDAKTRSIAGAHAVGTPPSTPPRLRVDLGLSQSLQPVASHDGFLVLCSSQAIQVKAQTCHELLVCDTLTGVVTSPPPVYVHEYYPPALLTMGADRSFELLIMRPYARPVVLGRTVHWLGEQSLLDPQHILALDVGAEVATMVELPWGYHDKTTPAILLAAVGGWLSLFVAEDLVVSMWSLTTSTPASAWSRKVVIGTQEIERQAGLHAHRHNALGWPGSFLAFGERSGNLILRMEDGKVIQINIGTKEVTMMCKYGGNGMEQVSDVFLHEVDLASLLQAMKSFC